MANIINGINCDSGKSLSLKARTNINIAWDGSPSGTSTASYTTKKECNYVIGFVMSVGIEWIEGYSQSITCPSDCITFQTKYHTSTLGEENVYFKTAFGHCAAGTSLGESVYGKTSKSSGYITTYIYTDE